MLTEKSTLQRHSRPVGCFTGVFVMWSVGKILLEPDVVLAVIL